MTLQESSLDPKHAVFDEVVPAGRGFAREVTRGQIVRIVDLEGNQAVDTLFYNARDLDERYSANDTIRGQGSLYLTTGTKLRVERGPHAAHHRRRHLRSPRHASAGPARPRATRFAMRSKRSSCTTAATASCSRWRATATA